MAILQLFITANCSCRIIGFLYIFDVGPDPNRPDHGRTRPMSNSEVYSAVVLRQEHSSNGRRQRSPTAARGPLTRPVTTTLVLSRTRQSTTHARPPISCRDVAGVEHAASMHLLLYRDFTTSLRRQQNHQRADSSRNLNKRSK